MTPKLLVPVLVCVSGCAVAVGPESERESAGSPGVGIDANRSLRIEPATVAVHVAEGYAVNQPFHAYMTQPDGSEIDVTGETTFTIADDRFGSFNDATLLVSGGGAGPVRVMARADGVTASGTVEVRVTHTEYGVGVPQDAGKLFATAIVGTNCGAEIVYPAETTMMANVGRLDMHWNGGTGDLFQVRVSNQWVERVIYTRAMGAAIGGTAWMPFATSKDRATITLAGMQSGATLTKCVAQTRTVRLTDTEAAGAIYYSETSGSHRTLVRKDMMDSKQAAPVFPNDQGPAGCVGCHAISRDGTRMAMTLDGASGRGAVVDFAEGRTLPMMGSPDQRWSSATFTPDGDKLLAVEDGQLKLFDVDSGKLVRAFETAHVTGNPEISPDGTSVVTVETTEGSDWQFASAQVVVRSFSADVGELGEAHVVLPFEDGVQSYYPSWSPDGQWLAVTRASGSSYANHAAEIFVVSADGTKGPYRITGSKGGSWARWMPFETKLDGEVLYFLSFTSTRAFGRQLEAGHEQIWMAPFFPIHANEDIGPITGPAFRAPWQSLTAENHNAQWATGIVHAVDGSN